MQRDEWNEEALEQEFERHPQKQRKSKPRVTRREELEESDSSDDFQMTYEPSRFEAGWLRDSLHNFYQQNLITDVLRRVKGGKEANVYVCRASSSIGCELLAAKVYRPRQFRNLRNDALYREGRAVLTAEGRPVKPTDHRLMRALGKKTEFGVQAAHTSWLLHEYVTLGRLHGAGASVPRPIGTTENAILMDYRGDSERSAPTLSEITLDQDEARVLFDEIQRNIALLLQLELIHGDLSAYNILYWEGKATLIDFPQVVCSRTNTSAETLFHRDVERVCDYFIRQGVVCDSAQIKKDLWSTHLWKQF